MYSCTYVSMLCLCMFLFAYTQQCRGNFEEGNKILQPDEMESWIIQKETIVKKEEKGANLRTGLNRN